MAGIGPAQVLSLASLGTQMNWSTPMNLTLGFACAALSVASPIAKPTVTMTSYFWSTKDWMFVA